MASSALDCDVFLLAAGFGKRLRPLTNDKPKPLVTVGGRSLIERNISMLAAAGCKRLIINVHYLGDMIREQLGDGSSWGLEIVYSEEEELLDTGGGIRNIEPHLRHQELLTFNSDILLGPDFSLENVLLAHRSCRAENVATMVLRPDKDVSAYGSLGVSAEGQVVEFLGQSYFDIPVVERLMFLGIQVLEREIFSYMPPQGSVFSITRDTLSKALSQGAYVNSHQYLGYWSDIGTIDRLEAASKECKNIFGIS